MAVLFASAWSPATATQTAAAPMARLARIEPGLAAAHAVPARILRVVDGDTLVVRARPWPGMAIDARVRLAGVDAPELRGTCEREKAKARLARQHLRAYEGRSVLLRGPLKMDSFGRLIAAVETDETSFGEVLIAAGLAVPYGEERNWCASETAAG